MDKNSFYLKTLLIALFVMPMFLACDDDDDPIVVIDERPLEEGVAITMRNTLEEPPDAEATFPALFGLEDDAWDEFGTLSNTTVEFPTALRQPDFGIENGLYKIDITEITISFKVIPEADDPFWGSIFGAFPEGKYDRYYFTFDKPHNVTGFDCDEEWVNVRIDSETVIVVELGYPYDLEPGVEFIIELK